MNLQTAHHLGRTSQRLTKLREHRATIAAQRALLAGYISLVPALCFAQVNVQSAASQILQVISLAFAAIAAIV